MSAEMAPRALAVSEPCCKSDPQRKAAGKEAGCALDCPLAAPGVRAGLSCVSSAGACAEMLNIAANRAFFTIAKHKVPSRLEESDNLSL